MPTLLITYQDKLKIEEMKKKKRTKLKENENFMHKIVTLTLLSKWDKKHSCMMTFVASSPVGKVEFMPVNFQYLINCDILNLEAHGQFFKKSCFNCHSRKCLSIIFFIII